MATLDDKILDGPNVGYCSSSEDEEGNSGLVQAPDDDKIQLSYPRTEHQTGPKGVLQDYKAFQKEQTMNKNDYKLWVKEQAMKLVTNPTNNDEEDDEDELEMIRKQRLKQLQDSTRGRVMEIPSKDEFLNIIENSSSNKIVIIHIYRNDVEECDILNDVLFSMSTKTTNVQYFKIKVALLETTDKFANNALPTLQVYMNGDLIGNYVRIDKEFRDEYGANDLIKFLLKKEINIQYPNDY